MPRWQPDARARLQDAALSLYRERGFDETTVAQIAERAGLTKRTFFRYFADKREVLFWGAERLEDIIVTAVRAAPPAASPLDAVGFALDTIATRFAQQPGVAATRYQIITATPELRERQLIKLAGLATIVAGELRDRGAGDTEAILAAEAGISVFRVSFDRWLARDARPPLGQVVADVLAQLRSVIAGPG